MWEPAPAPPSRRVLLKLLLVTPVLAPAGPAGRVTVVTNTSVEPYRQALDGLAGSLAASGVGIEVVDVPAAATNSAASQLLVAIGADALDAVLPLEKSPPVVCAMMLKSDLMRRTAAGGKRPVSTVYLDLSLEQVLSQLAEVFPEKVRIGVIRNPAAAAPAASELQEQASRHGFTARVVDCARPADLVRTLTSLKGEVNFVWCLPDASLYDGTTLKPLIMASLSNGLPLIGFSYSFVRAGAAIGVFPDFREVGAQTGEHVRMLLAGQAAPALEGPRKLKVAVNQAVARLLGLQFKSPQSGADFSVLR